MRVKIFPYNRPLIYHSSPFYAAAYVHLFYTARSNMDSLSSKTLQMEDFILEIIIDDGSNGALQRMLFRYLLEKQHWQA